MYLHRRVVIAVPGGVRGEAAANHGELRHVIMSYYDPNKHMYYTLERTVLRARFLHSNVQYTYTFGFPLTATLYGPGNNLLHHFIFIHQTIHQLFHEPSFSFHYAFQSFQEHSRFDRRTSYPMLTSTLPIFFSSLYLFLFFIFLHTEFRIGFEY